MADRAARARYRHAVAVRRTATALLSLLSLWFVGWLAVGDQMLAVRWGAFIAPWLGFLALAVASLFLIGSRRWEALASFLLALLILSPVLPRFSPARWSAVSKPTTVNVMTFNTSMLNTNYRAMAQLIGREHPDIVLLQQIADLDALKRALLARQPKRAYDSFPAYTADTVILSRYPLSDARIFDRQTTAVATIGGCRIRVWSIHAPHGQFDISDQHRFFQTIAALVLTEKLPLIVGGDFNSTEFNSVQAPLRAGLTDSFAAAGTGLGLTFPSHVRRLGLFGPLFRIDHILVRKFDPQSASALSDSANSDHYPTTASLGLTNNAQAGCARAPLERHRSGTATPRQAAN